MWVSSGVSPVTRNAYTGAVLSLIAAKQGLKNAELRFTSINYGARENLK